MHNDRLSPLLLRECSCQSCPVRTKANSSLIYDETPADYVENVDAMLIHHLERQQNRNGPPLLHPAQFQLSLNQNECFSVFQYRIIGWYQFH